MTIKGQIVSSTLIAGDFYLFYLFILLKHFFSFYILILVPTTPLFPFPQPPFLTTTSSSQRIKFPMRSQQSLAINFRQNQGLP